MKKLFVLAALGIFLLANTSIVLAEDSRSKREDAIKARTEYFKKQKESFQEQLKGKQELNWEKIQENLAARITKWEEAREKGQRRYINAAERIAKTIEKLKEKGIDTTKLEAMLKVYNQKVEAGFTSMGNGLRALEEAEKAADAKNLGNFVSSLATVNSEVKNGKDAYADARNYFKETLVPEMKQLLKEYKS